MKIQVTQDDIDAGIPRSCRRCPIAKALDRMNVPYFSILTEFVAWSALYYDEKNISILPTEALSFIQDFDHDRPVKPFEFELADPETYETA